MSTEKDICLVCAWRADCQKRFSAKTSGFRCPHFVRDITLPRDNEEKDKAPSARKGGDP